jgi:hypothetical protein
MGREIEYRHYFENHTGLPEQQCVVMQWASLNLARGVNVSIFTYNIFAKKLRNFWQSKVEQFMLNKNLITLLFKKTAQNGQRYRKYVVIPGFDNKIFFHFVRTIGTSD